GGPGAEWPGGCGHDLPQRRNLSQALGLRHGSVYRRQRHWWHERPLIDRRSGGLDVLARSPRHCRRARTAGWAAVLAPAPRIPQLPPTAVAPAGPDRWLRPACSRLGPALAVRARLLADGQLRDPVQLHRLPADRRSLPDEPNQRGPAGRGLPVGDLQLRTSGRAG